VQIKTRQKKKEL
jgi:hypothetical protein